MIAGTFLAAAAIEGIPSPVAGRQTDRRGTIPPITISLIAAIAVSLLAPAVGKARALIPVLVAGMPAFEAMFTPSMALLSKGAQRLGLDQGLAFGLGNLAWTSGQARGRGQWGGGQATSDLLPYCLLTGACLVTLVTIQVQRRRKEQLPS